MDLNDTRALKRLVWVSRRYLIRMAFIHLETYRHSRRVAGDLASFGWFVLEEYECEFNSVEIAKHKEAIPFVMEILGNLHDIGKFQSDVLPVIKLPRKLTAEEYNLVKTHPVKSREFIIREKILDPSDPVQRIWLTAIDRHHTRFDGKGYPEEVIYDGDFTETEIKEINFYRSLIELWDAVDTMRHKRVYKRQVARINTVLRELKNNAGSQFNPAVVEAIKCFLIKKKRLTKKQLAQLIELPAGST